MSNAKRKTAHLVVEDQPDSSRVVLLCEHCGERFTFLLPCSPDMFAGCTRVFLREHGGCRPAGSEK